MLNIEKEMFTNYPESLGLNKSSNNKSNKGQTSQLPPQNSSSGFLENEEDVTLCTLSECFQENSTTSGSNNTSSHLSSQVLNFQLIKPELAMTCAIHCLRQ